MINESLGVPEGISETGNNLLNDIIDKIDKLSYFPNVNDFGKYDDLSFLLTRMDIKIKEFEYKNLGVVLDIELHRNPNLNPVILLTVVGISSHPKFFFKDKKILRTYDINYKKNQSELVINLIVSESFLKKEINEKLEDLRRLIKKELKLYIIEHELMHLYDFAKRRKISNDKLIKYSTFNKIKGLPRSIEKLFFLMYYLDDIENIVRPTEFNSRLNTDDVKKSNFVNYIEKDEAYNMAKYAKNLTYDEFKNELYNDIDSVNNNIQEFMLAMYNDRKKHSHFIEFIDNIKSDFFESDNVDKLLIITYFIFSRKILDLNYKTLKPFLDDDNPFGIAKSLDPDRSKLGHIQHFKNISMEKFKKSYSDTTYKSVEEIKNFYKNEIKNLNIKGEKMMKKLSKLYAKLESKNYKHILGWDFF